MARRTVSGGDLTSDDTSNLMKVQRNARKKALERYSKWGITPTAIGVFIIGAAMLVVWGITRDSSTISMLMLLTGVSLITIAIMLYFLSPSRYLRSDVCDAMAITGTEDIFRILSSLLISTRGIYVPAGQAGATKLFIPLSGNINPNNIGVIEIGSSHVFNLSGESTKGIVIDPPGLGLYRYSRKIGALFTPEGLDNEIKDLLENGLELASKVRVNIEDDSVRVRMSRIVNVGMCSSIRRDNPGLCEQIGCPICSFLGCVIADGMETKVRARSVSVEGNKIDVTFELIGE